MSNCTHDLPERETAVADGYCPMCLVSTIEELQANYNELIFSVEKKHLNETRHETALRYIQQRERGDSNVAQSAPPKDKR